MQNRVDFKVNLNTTKMILQYMKLRTVKWEGQNLDPRSMDHLFGPGPWTPYFS